MVKVNFSAYANYVTDTLYQWDIGRVLNISGIDSSVAPEVHFSNANMERAIVRQATVTDNVISVSIPNSILQMPLTIHAHVGIYEADAFKVIEKIEIPVIARTRPADYQLEDSNEEIYSFNKLENEIVNAKKDIENLNDAYLDELRFFVSQNTESLNTRIDNIIAHNGDTESNTELIDIRTGADGTVYGSAGGAVRQQVSKVNNDVTSVKSDLSQLSSDITDVKSDLVNTIKKAENTIVYTNSIPNNLIIPYDLLSSKYVDMTGQELPSNNYNATKYIAVESNTPYYFASAFITCWYDINKEFISYNTDGYKVITSPANAVFMRTCISKSATMEDVFVCKGTVRLPYDDGLVKYVNRFKDYETGWIDFAVKVNTENWNSNKNLEHSDEILDSQTFSDVNCVLKLPATYTKDGNPTKLLMLCHGAGKGVNTTDSSDTWINNSDYNNLVESFVSNGYAVFDCNGYGNALYHCNFWGNRRGVQAWKNAYQYIINNYNVEHQFSIYGFSMGGLTALAIGGDMFPNVKCIALGSPVTNLKAAWDNGSNNIIATTYGMNSDTVFEEDRVIGCDPRKSIISINDTEYFAKQLPPIKVWFGSLETQPSPIDAERMVNAIRNANGVGLFRLVDGQTHDICWGADSYINNEYVMWVNRWNTFV